MNKQFHQIESESKKKFYLNEIIVKAARDLVVNRQVSFTMK